MNRTSKWAGGLLTHPDVKTENKISVIEINKDTVSTIIREYYNLLTWYNYGTQILSINSISPTEDDTYIYTF